LGHSGSAVFDIAANRKLAICQPCFELPSLAGSNDGARGVEKMTNKEKGEKLPGKGRTKSAFDPVQAALKQMYDGVASEEIPDDFMKLLDQLDHPSKPGSGK